MEKETYNLELLRLTAQVVAAHASAYPVVTKELAGVVKDVFYAFAACGEDVGIVICMAPDKAKQYLTDVRHTGHPTAIPLEASIKDEKIACLVCGEWFKMLRPHLKKAHGMTDKAYLVEFGLNKKYPFVAPAYSKFRAGFAREHGLGSKPQE